MKYTVCCYCRQTVKFLANHAFKEIFTSKCVLIILPHEHSTEIFRVFVLCDSIKLINMKNALLFNYLPDHPHHGNRQFRHYHVHWVQNMTR